MFLVSVSSKHLFELQNLCHQMLLILTPFLLDFCFLKSGFQVKILIYEGWGVYV